MYPSLEKHISKNILRYAINMEYNSNNVIITYSSMITPHTIFDYVVSNKEFTIKSMNNANIIPRDILLRADLVILFSNLN